MTTDVHLTKGEESFLAACRTVQALGLFPSNVNFARHTKYRLPCGARVVEMRDRLVAKGVLVLTEDPAMGRMAGRLLTDGEVAIIARLSLAEPRLTPVEIHARFVAETGRTSDYMTIFSRISRVRDGADNPPSGVRVSDEQAIRAKIDAETKERVEKDCKRIERIERRRNALAQVDRLLPAKMKAAEACEHILADFKARTGPRKPKADNRRTEFTGYKTHGVSRRMEHARHSTVSRRHAPYGMETAAG